MVTISGDKYKQLSGKFIDVSITYDLRQNTINIDKNKSKFAVV